MRKESLKCYVAMDGQDRCVLTRLDCDRPEWHTRTVKKNDFINFWYKKARVDGNILCFQFRAEDSFYAEWLEVDEKRATLADIECIFVLDDSVVRKGIADYLKREIEEYYLEHREDLQIKCNALCKCFQIVDGEKNLLLDAIRDYDETGSLRAIENITTLENFEKILDIFGKKWSRSTVLFSKNSDASKTRSRLSTVIYAGVFLLILSLIFTNIFSSPTFFFAPLWMLSNSRYILKKIENDRVLHRLSSALKDQQTVIDDITEDTEEDVSPVFSKELVKEKLAACDISYMERSNSSEHSFVRAEFYSFWNEFHTIDFSKDFTLRIKYMIRLLEIERRIYSKAEDRSDITDYKSDLLNSENLRLRLEFIGFAREKIEKEAVFCVAKKVLAEMRDVPFWGCETCAIDLYRVCISHMVKVAIADGSELATDPDGLLEIVEYIMRRIEAVQQVTKLKSAKKALMEYSSPSGIDSLELDEEDAGFVATKRKESKGHQCNGKLY